MILLLGLQAYTTTFCLCGIEDPTQGFVRARKEPSSFSSLSRAGTPSAETKGVQYLCLVQWIKLLCTSLPSFPLVH